MTPEQKLLLENCLYPSEYTVVDQRTTSLLVSIIRDLHKQIMVENTEQKTLRDEMAMAALTGKLSNPDAFGSYQELSERAYNFADAMMEARKK